MGNDPAEGTKTKTSISIDKRLWLKFGSRLVLEGIDRSFALEELIREWLKAPKASDADIVHMLPDGTVLLLDLKGSKSVTADEAERYAAKLKELFPEANVQVQPISSKSTETNEGQNTLHYTGAALSREHERRVKQLIEIFQSGNKKAITAVSENIEVFIDYSRVVNGSASSVPENHDVRGTGESGVQAPGAHRKSKRDASGGHPEPGKTGTEGR